MLTLVSFPAGLNEPSLSNFCTKAMILLNMAEQDWHPKFAVTTKDAPYSKLPYVQTPQGTVGDSNALVTYLEGQGAELFSGLTAAQRGQAHAVMRMAEENLRYGMMFDRWADPAGWAAFMPVVFGDMPAPLKLIIPAQVRKPILKGLKWQGLGRFDAAERQAYFQADLDALAAVLEGRKWLFGDQPCAADASVLPVLSGCEGALIDSALRRSIRANSTLMAYIERGREALYGPLLGLTSISAAA